MINYKLEKGYPLSYGATPVKDGVLFVFESDSDNSGIILKNRKSKTVIKVPLSAEYRNGNVYSVIVKDLEYDKFLYRFYSDEKEFADPYSFTIVGNEKFGLKKDNYEIYSSIVKLDEEIIEDKKPGISFENSIFYLLHVRGFTAHSSSKVESKGTFKGILEKIDYLKDLGITTLELMPAYEFEEYEKSAPKTELSLDNIDYKADSKVNYWGYKEGFYFAPKASYCAT
ncbi:MAG: hypothetical protein J5521_04220, partial [Lachnospiraceae bacterium]|nr:hypothetical protein [Lachnospiraceae bacterium]